MAKVLFWNPKLAEHEIMGNAAKRLDEVADMMADTVRKTIPTKIPAATTKRKYITRPTYKSGPNEGKWWTARKAGKLLKSVRVQKRYDDRERNVWIMVGTTAAYYGKIWEFKHRPFFRPAINRSKKKAIAIFGGK